MARRCAVTSSQQASRTYGLARPWPQWKPCMLPRGAEPPLGLWPLRLCVLGAPLHRLLAREPSHLLAAGVPTHRWLAGAPIHQRVTGAPLHLSSARPPLHL